MEHDTLLDMATDLGYELAMCGAETFRVEETVQWVMDAYGFRAEVFAIPNCLIVSIETDIGKPRTRMRRIGIHGNDLDGVELFSGLSRKICAQRPAPAEAVAWLSEARARRRYYPIPIRLLGHFLGAFGFSMLFGGSVTDGLCSGLCGLLVGAVALFLDRQQANQFFKILAASFPMALLAYALAAVGIAENADMVTIGALMLLVPGLLFTNAMRDIIFGDTNSGVNRIVQVVLIAVAIGLGTAAAWNAAAALWGPPVSPQTTMGGPITGLVPCLIGCLGFCIVFNIHGWGMALCAAGGILSWGIYSGAVGLGMNDLAAYFWATIAAGAYSEIMARIRKFPAISYLVVSIFPLIPGAGIYFAVDHVVHGQMRLFVDQAIHTAAVAGVMAVAILLVSTLARLLLSRRPKKK